MCNTFCVFVGHACRLCWLTACVQHNISLFLFWEQLTLCHLYANQLSPPSFFIRSPPSDWKNDTYQKTISLNCDFLLICFLWHQMASTFDSWLMDIAPQCVFMNECKHFPVIWNMFILSSCTLQAFCIYIETVHFQLLTPVLQRDRQLFL